MRNFEGRHSTLTLARPVPHVVVLRSTARSYGAMSSVKGTRCTKPSWRAPG